MEHKRISEGGARRAQPAGVEEGKPTNAAAWCGRQRSPRAPAPARTRCDPTCHNGIPDDRTWDTWKVSCVSVKKKDRNARKPNTDTAATRTSLRRSGSRIHARSRPVLGVRCVGAADGMPGGGGWARRATASGRAVGGAGSFGNRYLGNSGMTWRRSLCVQEVDILVCLDVLASVRESGSARVCAHSGLVNTRLTRSAASSCICHEHTLLL